MKNILFASILPVALIVSFFVFGISKTLLFLLLGILVGIVFGLSYLLISEWRK